MVPIYRLDRGMNTTARTKLGQFQLRLEVTARATETCARIRAGVRPRSKTRAKTIPRVRAKVITKAKTRLESELRL